jgi:hypothetical protein
VGVFATVQKFLVAAVVVSGLLCVAKPADAGGQGRFLGALVARGLVRDASLAARSNFSYGPKIYNVDFLTVAQLANCIRQATRLDGDNERLEAAKNAFLALKSEIDLATAAVEAQRPRVDHTSQQSVDAFNALVNRHNILVTNGRARQAGINTFVEGFNAQVNGYNAICVKKYYVADLPDAQKMAAAQP